MGAKSRAISRHTGFMLPLNRLPSSPFQQSFHSFRPISPVFVVPSFPEKLSTSLFSLLSIGKHDEVQVIQPHNQQCRTGWHKNSHPAQYMAFIKNLVTCQYLIIALSLSLIVMEGLWSVFGEYELAYYGVNKEQMMFSLCLSYGAALLLGTFLGILSDLIGHKKVCLIFCILHLFVGVWKRSFAHPGAWLASICLSLASSIFSLSFETWMVIEHDKLGHRQDALNDMFWLMTFTDSASFIGSQVIANWLVHHKMETSAISPSTAVVLLAILAIIFVTRVLKEVPQTPAFKDYRRDFTAYIFGDKRVWILAWAQACVQFSVAVFWILWAPTVVADGREVKLGLIYPCLLGARMLGSTVFPWFFTGPLSLRTEDFLVYVFIVMGFVLSIVAYDYQEIGVLVTLFCLFHACVGLILPSLARLRTMYIPNQLRGGMISLSLAPANAAILFFLLLRGYYQNIENSTILAFAALGLFSAAGCLHLLKRWGKQPNQNWHKP